jgi:hypothetical protein
MLRKIKNLRSSLLELLRGFAPVPGGFESGIKRSFFFHTHSDEQQWPRICTIYLHFEARCHSSLDQV